MDTAPRSVTVVGAGMVGLSTAWFLQQEGVDVTVVDRQGVAAGSSWGNAGWLSPALTLPLAEPAVLAMGARAVLKPSSPVYVPPALDPQLLRFLAGFVRQCTPRRWGQAMAVYARINAHSLGAFDELSAAGLPEPVREARPFLAAFASDGDQQAMVKELEHVAEAGGTVEYACLDEDGIRGAEPALGDGVRAGIRLDGQRFINPGRFVRGLGEAVERRGALMRHGSAVVDVVERGAGVDVRLQDGGVVSSDAVVVATGAWLPQLVRRFGVRRTVQAGRGYSFTVRPELTPAGPVYFPVQRVACTPLDPGFRVAGMMEFRRPDAPFDPRRVEAIVHAARPMLRGVDWQARTDEWVGSRPCTSDGLPLVGATRSPRVHVAGGHGMWGVVLGPLTGRLLARSMVRGERHDLMAHFDPLR